MRKTRAATRNCNIELLFRDLYDINGDRSRLKRWVEMTRAEFEC
jgi:arsenate reductase-like glutaredoxin family protein